MIIFTLHHDEHPAQGDPEHRRLIEESQVGPYLECRRRLKHGVRGNIQREIVQKIFSILCVLGPLFFLSSFSYCHAKAEHVYALHL